MVKIFPEGVKVNNRGGNPRMVKSVGHGPEGDELTGLRFAPSGDEEQGVHLPWASPTVINIIPLRGSCISTSDK